MSGTKRKHLNIFDKVYRLTQEIAWYWNMYLTTRKGTIGQGFGVITDIHVWPDDGYLYILALNGRIYRIVPSSSWYSMR